MIKEAYRLDMKENSPVFVIPWFNNCRVLVDTGATLPIWLKSIVPLKIKGAVKTGEKVKLNGVGGTVDADLYRVNFDFGSIHFKDLPVVHKELKVADAYMILSLFDFQYLKEKRQNYETFWINKRYSSFWFQNSFVTVSVVGEVDDRLSRRMVV